MRKIKKGDSVFVLSGKDKGKIGKVLKMLIEKDKAIVQGVNIAKKHTKPSQTNKGGIESIEMPIHISNLSFFDSSANKGVRIGYKLINNKKVRLNKFSGKEI